MRNRFDEQLEQLHVEIIKMGALCETAISAAAQCLQKEEKELQRQVFSTDAEIDEKEKEIESLCLRLLLHQQPVAGDLRRISAAMKMISDMERIGDQAADIAELAPYIVQKNLSGRVKIVDMARAAVGMVTDSVEAFVRSDLALAEKVIEEDDAVDALFDQIKEEIIEQIRRQDVDSKVSMDLLMAAKYLERIGDHAVNVAEWVQYSITGVHKSNEHHPDL